MSDVNSRSDFGDGNFAEYIARERDRLRAEREQVFSQQEELQRKLDAINREFVAIEAYETAKTGKNARQALAGRQPRARRGSRREALLELLRQSDGLSRGEILERMGLKGDKGGAMSVSNALTALARSNQIRREGGKYRAAA
jgi:hypothetical protein